MQFSSVWVDKYKYDDAETKYFTLLSKGECFTEHDCDTSSNEDVDWMGNTWTNKVECNDAERRYYEWCAKGLSKCNEGVTPEDCEKEVEPEDLRNSAYTVQCLAPDIKWANLWACKEPEKRYFEWRSLPSAQLSSSNGYDVYKDTSVQLNKEKCSKLSTISDQYHKNEVSDRRFPKFSNERETTKCNVSSSAGGTIADKIASCRQHIQKSLGEVESATPAKSRGHDNDVTNVITDLKKENAALNKAVEDLRKTLEQVITRVTALETANKTQTPQKKEEPKKEEPKKEEEEDDDDVDLFGSDSEEEDEKAKEEREKKLAAYAAKKAKKPGPIAKSNVIFDVKPWDDETDMKEMERLVRTVSTDGLLWGASKLVPLAYGIKKLQISCVVEDEKVSIDWLQETVEEFEDLVQSVDIAAFNKI